MAARKEGVKRGKPRGYVGMGREREKERKGVVGVGERGIGYSCCTLAGAMQSALEGAVCISSSTIIR